MPHKDPEKRRAYARSYYQAYRRDHPEQTSATNARWREQNRDRTKERDALRYSTDARWALKLKTSYGMTPEDYYQILAKQGGVCAICKKHPKGKLHVDHNHATMKVRGLLCGPCNRGLGMFHDDRLALQNAATYLQEES